MPNGALEMEAPRVLDAAQSPMVANPTDAPVFDHEPGDGAGGGVELLEAATPSMEVGDGGKLEDEDGNVDVDVDVDIDADSDDAIAEGEEGEVEDGGIATSTVNGSIPTPKKEEEGGGDAAKKVESATESQPQEGDAGAEVASNESGEAGEEEAPATIAAVPESNDDSPKTSEQEDDEAVIAKIEASVKCHRVEVLPSGEILVLPKGWSTRQSKTHGGHTYYVSPYGQTQWLRPSIKTGLAYKWNHEIEVTFGPGRLGLNLKQITAEPGKQFTDIPVYIAEIYKLAGGPSPAEIYNWGVKPEKRLCVGMRMTAMNGAPLTGYSYSEVLDKVTRMPRPLRIKFADITKGIVGRVEKEKPAEETQEQKEARAALMMQKNLRTECFRVDVARELRLEVWTLSRKRMHRNEQEINQKIEILTKHLAAMNEMHTLFEKESESLTEETNTLQTLLEKLGEQEAGKIESPEVAKSAELQARNASLDEEIKGIMAENEELLRERTQTEEALDSVMKELEEYGDDVDLPGLEDFDAFSNAFLGSLVDRGSIDQLAENARERLLEKIRLQQTQFQAELVKQEERVRVAEADVEQFKQQMSSADALFQREYDDLNGERPAQLVMLEEKITTLQATLHETVEAVMRAATAGDRVQLNEKTIERGRLTEDLQKTINEFERLQSEYGVRGSSMSYRESDVAPFGSIGEAGRESYIVDRPSPSASVHDNEVVQLRARLNSLQKDLLETVNELAGVGTTKDEKEVQELNERRTRLKEDIEEAQQQLHALARQSLTRPPRASSSRPSNTGRVAMDLGASPPVGLDRVSSSDSSDLHGMNRPSTAPSNASMNPSSIVDTSDGHGMPTIAGPLMKHPTHSNERGLFRNIKSLRGVRERYCVLDGTGTLKYFKRKSDREPRGVIPLDLVSLEVVCSKNEPKSTQFSLCTSTYQNKFDAKNHTEMLRWVAALEKTHEILMQQRAEFAATKASISSRPNLSVLDTSTSGTRSPPDTDDTTEHHASLGDSHARGAAHRATLGF